MKKQISRKLKLTTYFLITFIIIIVIVIGVGIFHYHQQNSKQPIYLTAVGDSLTQGIGDNDNMGGYPYITQQLFEKRGRQISVHNFGVAGDTTNQISNRVIKNKNLETSLKNSNVISVTTGGNDLLKLLKKNLTQNDETLLNNNLDYSEKTYENELNLLIKRIRKYNNKATIYIFGIYNPVYVYFPSAEFIQQSITSWNSGTQKVIKQHKNVYYIPIDKQLTKGQYQSKKDQKKLLVNANKDVTMDNLEDTLNNSSKELNEYLSNDDHFHPNKKGYQFMAKQLYNSINRNNYWEK